MAAAPTPKAATVPGRKRAENRAAPPTVDASERAAPIAGGKYASKGLYGYIWAISSSAQLLSVFIFLLDLIPLELQRRIVNEAIGNKIFLELIWLCGVYAVTALCRGGRWLHGQGTFHVRAHVGMGRPCYPQSSSYF